MKNLLDGLNEAQLQAVTSKSKVILTLAGAGSGKTTVLTKRIADLSTNHRVGTSSMLALTFTRLAGKEMKERVIHLIGDEEGKKLFCNTFHAFAVSVLKEHGWKIGVEENFTIYEQSDREEIMKRIIEEFGNRTTLKQVMTRFDNCKDVEVEKINYPEECRVLIEYGYRLRQNNAVDLDRLVDLVNRLWTLHPEVLAHHQNQFSHVFVDEFQDTSDEQMEMIGLLNPRNLFIVGDDFQAIYGWRKAKVEYIIDFPTWYPECEVIKLEDNYRSTRQIVEPANRLISHNEKQTDKRSIAHKDGEQLHIGTFPTEEVENLAIVSFVEALHQDGLPLQDMAILARTNQQIAYLKNAFDKAAIPAQRVSGDDDVFKKQDIKQVLAWLNVICNNKDTVSVKKALRFPRPLLTDLELHRFELEALRNDVTLFEVLEKQNEAFIELYRLIEKELLEKEVHSPGTYFMTLIKHLGLMRDYQEKGLQNRTDDIDIAFIAMHQWKQTQQALGESYSPSAFLRWLRTKDIQEKLMEQQDAVKLMTVHASKGLEFDTVIVSGMNQGTFPSRRSGDFEEERRLFYVAVTRAKNRLILTRAEKVAQPWGKQMIETQTSQFINELVGGETE